jgi:hypothetical protein
LRLLAPIALVAAAAALAVVLAPAATGCPVCGGDDRSAAEAISLYGGVALGVMAVVLIMLGAAVYVARQRRPDGPG